MIAIERRYMQRHRLAAFERDLVRCEFESFCGDRNLARRRILRANRKRRGNDDEAAIADAATPELQLPQRTDVLLMRRAIENLPVVFREVLLMSDVEEMTYKEIAETLSIPIGTVTSRLIRARQKVRKALRGER